MPELTAKEVAGLAAFVLWKEACREAGCPRGAPVGQHGLTRMWMDAVVIVPGDRPRHSCLSVEAYCQLASDDNVYVEVLEGGPTDTPC